MPTELPDLVTAVLGKAATDRKRYPCYVNRASSLGYFVPELDGCHRRGVYERTRWEEKELWEPESILRFREGDRQESHVLRDLADVDIQIIEQQQAFQWKEYEISGHLDGKVVVDGVAIPVEIKSMSPMIFQQVHSLEDFRKYPWTTVYIVQITLYMLMSNTDRGIFLLKDKSSGLLRQINVELDYDLGELCIKTAQLINRHVKAGTLPERTDNRQTCAKCPFRHVCLPDIEFGEPLKIMDDPMFEQRLDEALALKEASSEYKKLWDIVKEEAKATAGESGELNVMVGKYHLTAKSGKSFRLNVEVL